MLESRAWRAYRDGTGDSTWLSGEFDYFLAVWCVTADDVSRLALTDEQKAALLAAGDRRQTGTARVRRSLEEAAQANPHAGLLEHWQRYGWAEKTPISARTVARLQSGTTWEQHAQRRRLVRLRESGSWKRVEAAVSALDTLTDDEIRGVIELLRQRLQRIGRPVALDEVAQRKIAERCDWSPTKCAAAWQISIAAAKKRLERLRKAG